MLRDFCVKATRDRLGHKAEAHPNGVESAAARLHTPTIATQQTTCDDQKNGTQQKGVVWVLKVKALDKGLKHRLASNAKDMPSRSCASLESVLQRVAHCIGQ